MITLKDPYDHLLSLYLHKINNWNFRPDTSIFLETPRYSKLSRIDKGVTFKHFNLDLFCYETLVKLYRDRFRRVVVGDLKSVLSLKLLATLDLMDDEDLVHYRSKLARTRMNASPSLNSNKDEEICSIAQKFQFNVCWNRGCYSRREIEKFEKRISDLKIGNNQNDRSRSGAESNSGHYKEYTNPLSRNLFFSKPSTTKQGRKTRTSDSIKSHASLSRKTEFFLRGFTG